MTPSSYPPYPISRPRRLRSSPAMRRMVRETTLAVDDLIYPLFVRYGSGERREIESMPGQYQWSVDRLSDEIGEVCELGIPAVLLFGIPECKDATGSGSHAENGIIQQAIQAIKSTAPELIVITDVCLCEYTDHGHCGLLNADGRNPALPPDVVLNDETLDVLGEVAISQAKAGADMVAPSGMMDGMVAAIRTALDSNGYAHIPIMSYAVKYGSSFYGPFREAAEGAPKSGDRRSHQMDPANGAEALREASIDVAEGADMLIVKPAMPYLDIIHSVSQAFAGIPTVAYNVSGEYAMVKAAALRGWLDEEAVVMEMLTGMRRAGADMIVTYHAKVAARWLREQ